MVFTGGTSIPIRILHQAVVLPYVEIGGRCGPTVVIDSEVRIPEGLVVGGIELDAKRFRRTEAGVTLITGPMIEKLNSSRALMLPSVASSSFRW